MAYFLTRSPDRVYGPQHVLAIDGLSSIKANFIDLDAEIMGPLSLLLINDHPAASHAIVQAEVERIVENHREQGWMVVIDDQTAEVEVRKLLPPGAADAETDLSPLLRNTLMTHDLGGIILFKAPPGPGEPHKRTRAHTIIMPKSPEQPVIRFEVELPKE